MRVNWTPNALRHLRAIHDYIAADSPRYAVRMVDRITRRTQQLSQLPLLGAEVDEYSDPASENCFSIPTASFIEFYPTILM